MDLDAIGNELRASLDAKNAAREQALPLCRRATRLSANAIRAVHRSDKAETLRLCFATPPAWLADGKEIKVSNAPTQFGPVSFTIQSKLSQGIVDVDLDLPTRNPPAKSLLRLRLPDGAKLIGSSDGETIDISNLHGHATMQAKVSK